MNPKILLYLLLFAFASTAQAQSVRVKEKYQKFEYKIPMRDGVKLHTAVYVPKRDSGSTTAQYPFLMQRTCYAVEPYGEDKYPGSLGPSKTLMNDKYIFVYQDVRGRYMSEGTWTNMTPHIPNKSKPSEVDEASDTYDTIDWLLKNVPNNNGRVGQWGISYPGYYTIAGALSQHPALKASSPQAPIADFFFDDFHHNGAFVLQYFLTFPVFGVQTGRPTSATWWARGMVQPGTSDGYQFYMDLGPLSNGKKFYPDNFYWKETVEHPNYDEFWQKRSIVPHLKGVKHAVMTVGGWFDAEDLYGPLTIYKTLEKTNPGTNNTLVVGPFGHGRWSFETGHTLHGNLYFGDSIATFYQRNIEAPFFQHYLKGSGDGKTGLPEAYLFDTGKKEWRQFGTWPAKEARKMNLNFRENGHLSEIASGTPQSAGSAFSEYVSDPMKPVPVSENYQEMLAFTPFNYMSEDQRFAGRRPDVLVFQTDVLENDLTLGGEITAQLKVSTTGTDADWVVKLIDVYPADEKNHAYMPNKAVSLSNYQQMVRSEVMRGRFRDGFTKPLPFRPNQVTDVNFRLQDVLHTFKKGHRVMVQVQSSWFPLIDRNPQKFVPNIFEATEKDFIKATHRVYHSKAAPSLLKVEVLE